jgi:hypothetical protein
MRSIEQQLSDLRESILATGKCVAADLLQLAKGESLEVQFSATQKYAKDRGITLKESAPARVARKNGRSISESADTKQQNRIVNLMRGKGLSFQEATCFATGEVVRDAKNPDYVKNAIRESWKSYLPTISSRDLETLVSKGVFAPKV